MKHLLVPIDGSETAYRALRLALDLAEQHDAEVTLLHVTPAREIPPALRRFAEVEHTDAAVEWLYDKALAERMLEAARGHAEGRNPRRLNTSVRCGDPASSICEVASELEADAIVMGSRGLSEIGGLVMGSVSRKVSHGARCTVITVR